MRRGFVGAILLCLSSQATAAPIAYDVILRGGTVLDGSGGPARRADVAIRGDRILRIGDLGRATALQDYDATGLFVTPGFVSIHDHTDDDLHARPIGLASQGVTTAIGNPDGFGPTDIMRPLRASAGLGINYGAYVGFNSVWEAVVGNADRHATPAEIARMRGLIRTGLEQGAFGVSAGLDYKPGFFATTDEVIAVVSAARGWRTNFPNHDRLYAGNGFSSLAGMAETVRIGAAAGLEPVVTHMHLLSRDQGRADQAFAMFAASARDGVAVGVDAYPYTYAATALEQILVPAWAQAGGKAEMLRRFADPAARGRIVAETDAIIADRIRGAGNIYLPDMSRELSDLAADWKVGPGEAILRLLEQGQTHVILRSVTDADEERVLRDPATAISCDCGAIASTTGHPRNWGSYPRFFGHYVRERKLVDWPEAVRRATALPAAMIGLAERGWLRPGMIADVTVFDPATIADRATIEHPAEPSVGIRAVLVNGRFAWRDGAFQPAAGRMLARSRHEPTRTLVPLAEHRLDGDVVLRGGAHAVIKATMRGAAEPNGRAIVSGLPGGRAFTLDHMGLLQTARGWAALTGVGHWRDGREAAATLFVEAADPARKGMPGLTLTIDGRTVLDGAIVRGRPVIDGRFPQPRTMR